VSDLDESRAETAEAAVEPGPGGLGDPERRRDRVQRVAAWLDELEEPEPPPPGLAPEATSTSEQVPDLFSLLAQLAALTRETQLQGRATNLDFHGSQFW
jgi:hypothetical protein